MSDYVLDRVQCVAKKNARRGGAPFTRVELRRLPNGARFTRLLPDADAVVFTIGGRYKIFIVPDDEPVPVVAVNLAPGDHVLHSWRLPGRVATEPAVVIRLTGRSSAVVRTWRHGTEKTLRLHVLKPVTAPFPDPESSVILPGDSVRWERYPAIVLGLVGSDEALIKYFVQKSSSMGSYSWPHTKVVKLSTLAPPLGQ
jgi:hypothetical protein